MIDPCSRIEKNKTAAIKSGIYAIKFDCSFFVVLGLLYIIIKYRIGVMQASTLVVIVKIVIVRIVIDISNVRTKGIIIELILAPVIVFFFSAGWRVFGAVDPTEHKKVFYARAKVTSPVNIP